MNSQENNNIANAHIIYLSKVKPSNFNPRKTFRDADLTELAESIRTQGVLQPIMVRPRGNEYEIIYGERRYRAALLAGLEIIPALVRDLTDETAMEYALTENIQRQDVSPIEEATAYKSLIENNRYDIPTLMNKFGKSESYIRSRMRLNSLIQPFADLLLTDDISLSVALELCKYSNEVQDEIFADHFQNPHSYNNWSNKSAKEVISFIGRNYSTDLNKYYFDKSECYDCQYNTEKHNLFAEGNGCGNCLNTACLKAKNTAYIVERAKEFVEKNPELALSVTNMNACKDAVDILTEQEYMITKLDYCRDCPTPPIAPEKEDYDTEEDYNEAKEDYEGEVLEYQSNSAELCDKYKSGEITIYANIGTTGVSLGYLVNNKSDKEKETPLAKLTEQDKRFKEIEREKIVADTKELAKSLDPSVGEFSTFEERIMYYAMLKHIRHDHINLLGITPKHGYLLTDEERMQILSNLTETDKTIIRRDFIMDTLKEAFRDETTANLLMEFAEQHAPEELATIKAKHAEVYDKRHTRISEKIAAIQAEQAEEPTSIKDEPSENE